MTTTTEFNFTDIMFGIAIPPVTHEGRLMINGRNLHDHLGVDADLAHWILDYLRQFPFEEGVDYVVTSVAAPQSEDYLFTFDLAKGLAMQERSELGVKTVRHLTKLEKATFVKAAAYALQHQVDAMTQMISKNSQQLEDFAARMGSA